MVSHHLFSFVVLALFLALSLTFFPTFLCTIPVTPVARDVALCLSHMHAHSLSHSFSSILCLFCVLSCTRSHSVRALTLACSFWHTHFLAHLLSLFCSFPVPLTFAVTLTLSLSLVCPLTLILFLIHVLALSFSFSLLCSTSLCPSLSHLFSHSSQTSCILLFLGKICPFCYPGGGQGLVIQDNSIPRDNTAL